VQEVPIIKTVSRGQKEQEIVEDAKEMEPFRSAVIEMNVQEYWKSDPTLQESIFFRLLCTYRESMSSLDHLKLDITV
jgi:hypothetical protein